MPQEPKRKCITDNEHEVYPQCMECGSSKTRTILQHSRNLDEGMIITVICIKCGNKWNKEQ
jgi:DNA-directed RNA polymerase subunit M/transcription elongation factor TFIIS